MIVTLTEIKNHLEMDPDENRDDGVLYDLIQVAEAEAEDYINNTTLAELTGNDLVKARHAVKLRVKYYFDVDRGEVTLSKYKSTQAFHKLLSGAINYTPTID